MAQPTKLTEGSWAALNAMRAVEGGVTLAELNAQGNQIASAHMGQLNRKGLVEAALTEFVCPTCGAKAKRNVYTLTEAGQVYTEE